jgi:hypothetical protein
VVLAAVVAGVVLSAVGRGITIGIMWLDASRHPSSDWRTDPTMNAELVTILLVVPWLVGALAALFTGLLTGLGSRPGQVALTVLLGLVLAYNCSVGYHDADEALDASSGVMDQRWVDQHGGMVYLGGVRTLLDLALVLLAVLALVLLWVPAARRFYARGGHV